MKQLVKYLLLCIFFVGCSNSIVFVLPEKIANLQHITDMPYICRDSIGTQGCGQSYYWDVVLEKGMAIPYLLDNLDDSTQTKAVVPNFGGYWTVGDIAYSALSEIIHGIPTLELLPGPAIDPTLGFGNYWNYVREKQENRIQFQEAVYHWYTTNRSNLEWIESENVNCDCSFSNPNGGYYVVNPEPIGRK